MWFTYTANYTAAFTPIFDRNEAFKNDGARWSEWIVCTVQNGQRALLKKAHLQNNEAGTLSPPLSLLEATPVRQKNFWNLTDVFSCSPGRKLPPSRVEYYCCRTTWYSRFYPAAVNTLTPEASLHVKRKSKWIKINFSRIWFSLKVNKMSENC